MLAFRADHIGSLLRPKALREAFRKHAGSELGEREVSPQCGFASTMGGNPVTEADQRAKLKLCVDAARAIWGQA